VLSGDSGAAGRRSLGLPEQPYAPKARLLDGPNFWIPQDPEGFNPHGYVVLDFDRDAVLETYRVRIILAS
jgi:hypothetical protein